MSKTNLITRLRGLLSGLLSKEKPAEAGFLFNDQYLTLSHREPQAAYRHFRVSAEGLSLDEVAYRLQIHGRNEIQERKKAPLPVQFLKTLLNPFVALLIVLAIVSFLTDDVPGGVIVSIMVIVSTTLTFFQEFRSSRAAESLKSLVTTRATVIRRVWQEPAADEGAEAGGDTRQGDYIREYRTSSVEVPFSEIVPGDLVQLAAGDMIPADLRLLTSRDLFVSQSALTGESLPVEKISEAEPKSVRNLPELRNLCFMGSSVVSGTATAIVLRTGNETYLGSLAQNVTALRVQTSFDQGINQFTWLMLRFMMVMVPLVFLVNGLSKGNWLEAFTFAIAVAVGLTPEMLPMIITVNLAKGGLAMSKERVIVKRLNAIQNFGAMDVLCTDKTGTLTQDRVILERYVDPFGNENPRVLNYAFLNSFHQTGLRNLLDIAVLRHAEVQGSLAADTAYKKVDELPFDFVRRRMSVIVEEGAKKRVLICKGALEEIFKISSQLETEGKILPISKEFERESLAVARRMNEDGLRVIAVGYRDFPLDAKDFSVSDEKDLTLIGFIAFLDPPKDSAAEAIRALNRHGVQVKVLTGDNEVVTRKVCREVGLPVERILLGQEIAEMSDEELSQAAESVAVFAKLTPDQKKRIVNAIQLRNHVVGFMGDGINDSPALKAADVGISVDTAVDIAKESSDIILLEKNLLVLERGVLEGRKVFGNIIKYIKMGASSNFGNVFSVVGASMFLPFLPMLPVQLLTQNLLYDLSQTTIPLDKVDEEYLAKPRRWEIGNIRRFMMWFGPVSSLFDYLTFALLWFVFKANTVEKQGIFQAGWFIEGLLSQTFVVHMIRTAKIPFIQSIASPALLTTTGLIMGVGLYIPYSPLASKLGLVAPPLAFLPWLAVFLISYAVLAQLVKVRFIRKFGYD